MGIVKKARTAVPAKTAPQMKGAPSPATPPPIEALPPNATDGTATGAPAPVKKPRGKRAPVVKEFGGAVISEVKGTAEMDGYTFPVRKFAIVFGEGDARNATRATLRDALVYVRSLNPKAPRSAAGRKANPNGTLAILRAGKAIATVAALRAPELRDALNAATAALRSDLDWQISQGVNVAAIEAAEVGRIDKMAAKRAEKKAAKDTNAANA